MKSNRFNRLQIEVFFFTNYASPYISPSPNIDPSNLSFVHVYAQGVLTVFTVYFLHSFEQMSYLKVKQMAHVKYCKQKTFYFEIIHILYYSSMI